MASLNIIDKFLVVKIEKLSSLQRISYSEICNKNDCKLEIASKGHIQNCLIRKNDMKKSRGGSRKKELCEVHPSTSQNDNGNILGKLNSSKRSKKGNLTLKYLKNKENILNVKDVTENTQPKKPMNWLDDLLDKDVDKVVFKSPHNGRKSSSVLTPRTSLFKEYAAKKNTTISPFSSNVRTTTKDSAPVLYQLLKSKKRNGKKINKKHKIISKKTSSRKIEEVLPSVIEENNMANSSGEEDEYFDN